MTKPAERTRTKSVLKLASRNATTGDILYTWELTFPRNILAELNTHRATSKNTSSSRAISLKKLREKVWLDPYLPIHIGQEQKGMQAAGELTGWRRTVAETLNSQFRYAALLHHWCLMKLGVHKQVANRYLEPWMWCKVVLSATDVNNLLMLRTDTDAEPNFRDLAVDMAKQVEWVRAMAIMGKYGSNPNLNVECYQPLVHGLWHLPYIAPVEYTTLTVEQQKQLSVARCANTSFTLPNDGSGITTMAVAERINQKLFGGRIKHLSPTEHVATPMRKSEYWGNFKGWKQFRKTILGESGGDREDTAGA